MPSSSSPLSSSQLWLDLFRDHGRKYPGSFGEPSAISPSNWVFSSFSQYSSVDWLADTNSSTNCPTAAPRSYLLLILVSTFAAVSGGYRAYVVNVAMSASEYESYGSKTGFERWRLRLLRFRSRFPFTEAAVLRRSGSIPDGVLNPRRLRISASLAISALGTPILAIVLANAATTRLGADQLFPLFLAIAIGCINMLLATMIRISDLIKPYGKQGQMLPSADLLVKAEDAPKNI